LVYVRRPTAAEPFIEPGAEFQPAGDSASHDATNRSRDRRGRLLRAHCEIDRSHPCRRRRTTADPASERSRVTTTESCTQSKRTAGELVPPSGRRACRLRTAATMASRLLLVENANFVDKSTSVQLEWCCSPQQVKGRGVCGLVRKEL